MRPLAFSTLPAEPTLLRSNGRNWTPVLDDSLHDDCGVQRSAECRVQSAECRAQSAVSESAKPAAWPRHCPAAKCKHAGKAAKEQAEHSGANNPLSLSLSPSSSPPQIIYIYTPLNLKIILTARLLFLPQEKARTSSHWHPKCSTPQSASSTTSSMALPHPLPSPLLPRNHQLKYHLRPLPLPSMTRCTRNANSGSCPTAPARASALSPQQDL